MKVCSPIKPCGVFRFSEVFKLSPEELKKLSEIYNGLRILRIDADRYRLAHPESPDGKVWAEFSRKLGEAELDLERIESYWLVFA